MNRVFHAAGQLQQGGDKRQVAELDFGAVMETSHNLLSGGIGGSVFDARDESNGKNMLSTIRLFDGELRHIAPCRQHEVGVLDAIFASVCHPDHERTKGLSVEQFADSCFHAKKLAQVRRGV